MNPRLVWAIFLLVLVAVSHAVHPGHDSGEHDDHSHSHGDTGNNEHHDHGDHSHSDHHDDDGGHSSKEHDEHKHGDHDSHEGHEHGPDEHGDSHEGHDSHESELKEFCRGECPEFEVLCHTHDYDVRRYKSALWISTTVSDPSLYQGHVRGWNRLHKYIRGGNKEGVKMPYTAPLVTQTRQPQESPFHEVTVSMPLPKDMAKNPPTPNDPHVVIDLVPESVMYVKKFRGRAARVGFVAEREAKKFFTLLDHHHEPFHGMNDYFYIAQYDSRSGSSDPKMYNEIWVFAINERTFKWLEFNDLAGHGEGLPHCLHHDDRIGSWHKMDQADIPVEALARRQCSETYCEAPKKCPKYSAKVVKEVDDETITIREEKDLKAVGVVPLTCNYDTAMHSTPGPLMQYLNETGIPLSDVAATMTAIVEKRDEIDGKEGCGKFYKVYFGMGGGSGKPEDDYTLDLNEDLFHAPKTIKALHGGEATGGNNYYIKCFGGNAYYEPTTVTATSKRTMEKLRDAKKCMLEDHLTVIEYHSQSRLFDRFNEINIDADLDCSDQEGRPEFTFHLPLSKSYNRDEAKPVFGDRCTTYECPEMSIAMRFENNLRLMKHPAAKWVCSNSTDVSCSYEQAWEKALQPILSYINGKNEDNVRMDMTRPLYGQGHTGEKGNECVKTFTLCMYMPKEYTENPPKPIDDNIGLRSGDKESYWFQSVFVGQPTPERLHKSLTDMTEQLDALKPFGVDYSIDGQELWFGGYDDPDDEQGLYEIIVVDQQHIYWKAEEKEGEEDEEETEETDKHEHDWVDLPKPTGCNDETCLEIHVTKEHDDFMEIHFPKTKGVCQWSKGCLKGSSGRSSFLPLFKYFNGDNAENEVIGDMTSPIVVQVKTYSEEEETEGVSVCEREYQTCARLPDAWIDQGKDIPKPNGEGMSTVDDGGSEAYAFALKGVSDAELAKTLTERIAELSQKLEEKELEFNKDWLMTFRYPTPFAPIEEKVTYMAFLKPSGETGGEDSEDKPASDEGEGESEDEAEAPEGKGEDEE
ncbi:HEBP2 [Branchiostoma lanceolatum]|uniref:HEBP2 protein n=1 Tax=Branchiostoma lanceolatum TaxID=7740 RepID=A0A8K0F2T5_BRALA|nr:HEBP2 [Branchiostoma lanceolatum]